MHPYDVLEAEPEVVSGYYVDYGGVVFMLIYLAEGVSITMLLMMSMVLVGITSSSSPTSCCLYLWSLVSLLLLVRYSTCRYRVADALSYAVSYPITCGWILLT